MLATDFACAAVSGTTCAGGRPWDANTASAKDEDELSGSAFAESLLLGFFEVTIGEFPPDAETGIFVAGSDDIPGAQLVVGARAFALRALFDAKKSANNEIDATVDANGAGAL
jgi:hypothetical protein